MQAGRFIYALFALAAFIWSLTGPGGYFIAASAVAAESAHAHDVHGAGCECCDGEPAPSPLACNHACFATPTPTLAVATPEAASENAAGFRADNLTGRICEPLEPPPRASVSV